MRFKSLTDNELDYIFQDVDFPTTPFEHQLQSLAFGMNHPRRAFFLDIGLGKTLTALYAAQLDKAKRILVVCPNSVVDTWIEETVKHTDMVAVDLRGTADERWRKLQRLDVEVHVINYEGLRVLWGMRVPKEEGGEKYIANLAAIRNSPFDCVIIDEAHHCSDAQTLQSNIIHGLCDQAETVSLLTGTPLANSYLDLWSLMYCLDQGDRLGVNFWAYRSRWFRKYGFKWYPKHGAKDTILKHVNELSISYSRDECFDLPPITRQIRKVQMTDEQHRVQKRLLEGLAVKVQRGTVTVANALVAGTKLAQVANGFLLDDNGEIIHLAGGNPKADDLKSLLNEVSSKAIIFHRFDEDARQIEGVLKKRGTKFSRLRGEIPSTDRAMELTKFRLGSKYQFMVANAKCGGEGLNLQAANICIFYSSDYSAVSREQCEGRIYRIGQELPCLFVDIVAEGSIDEPILDAVGKKRDLGEAVLDFIRKNS